MSCFPSYLRRGYAWQSLAIAVVSLSQIIEAQTTLSTVPSTTPPASSTPSSASTASPNTDPRTSASFMFPTASTALSTPGQFMTSDFSFLPTGTGGFSPTGTACAQEDSSCDEFPGGGGASYYYIFIAIFFLVIAIAVWVSHTRRRRRNAQNALNRQSALARDMRHPPHHYPNDRRWPGERRAAGRHRRGVSGAEAARDEGLDERGEAPPPYKRDDDGNLVDTAGVAIPMQTLNTDRLNKPPEYHEAAVSPSSPAGPSDGEAGSPRQPSINGGTPVVTTGEPHSAVQSDQGHGAAGSPTAPGVESDGHLGDHNEAGRTGS